MNVVTKNGNGQPPFGPRNSLDGIEMPAEIFAPRPLKLRKEGDGFASAITPSHSTLDWFESLL